MATGAKKTISYHRSSWVCTCGAVNGRHRNECRKCGKPKTEATKRKCRRGKKEKERGEEE
jgi:hypothetical protein